MAKRLNIGADIDGVLANFTKGGREVCQALFGKPDPNLVQTGWGFDSLGLSSEEERSMWETIDHTANWWLHLDRLPNTTLLKPLCDKHRVIFITNRKDGQVGMPIEEQSSEWLRRHFRIFNPTVVISDKKGPVASGLKLDFYIDDRPKNYYEVLQAAPTCRTALQDATYNQECGAMWRVPTFDAFASTILGEYNGGRD